MQPPGPKKSPLFVGWVPALKCSVFRQLPGHPAPGSLPEPWPPVSEGLMQTTASTIPSGRGKPSGGRPPTTVFM